MVLGDVEETLTTTEADAETGELTTRTVKRTMPMLYVRGDIVTLVSPPAR